MGKLELTDEQRKERSERMSRLNAEGKAGAAFGKLGGRPKVRRATEIAVEEIQKEGKALAERLLELTQSDSEKTSLDAIKLAFGLEEQERKATIEEEVRYDQLKHGELADLVIGNLFELIREGQIDIGEIGIVEDAEISGLIESGETN